jgi:hypothetical protein
VAPFICLTKKDQHFFWGVEVDNAFQSLKVSFTMAPFFYHVNFFKPFVLKADDFNFVIGVTFSQFGKDN